MDAKIKANKTSDSVHCLLDTSDYMQLPYVQRLPGSTDFLLSGRSRINFTFTGSRANVRIAISKAE